MADAQEKVLSFSLQAAVRLYGYALRPENVTISKTLTSYQRCTEECANAKNDIQ